MTNINSRPSDQQKILAVLLGSDGATNDPGKVVPKVVPKVVAHGMGGLGKTVIAAYCCRNVEVRTRYARIGFVSAGQAPMVMELQVSVGRRLPINPPGSRCIDTKNALIVLLETGADWLAICLAQLSSALAACYIR